MKIYNSPVAPNPRRVRVFLAEKGISVPYEDIDIGNAVNRQPEFRKKNPLAGVPVLELDDGTCIAESVAICRYFEALNPEPPMFGVGAKDQAVVEMWQRRCELSLFFPIAQVFRHTHPAMKELEVPQVPAWAEANRPRVLDFLRILDAELGKHPFIAGERYTVADITALCAIDFMKPARIAVPEELTHLKRWHAEVSARPSAKA